MVTQPDLDQPGVLALVPLARDVVQVNRAAWIAALESGDYPQARNRLRKSSGYCCLGVAEELREPDWAVHTTVDGYSPTYALVDQRVYLLDPKTREVLLSPAGNFVHVGLVNARNGTALTGPTAYWLGLCVADPNVVVYDASSVSDDPDSVDPVGWDVKTLSFLNDERLFSLRDIAAVIRDQDPDWDGTSARANLDALTRARAAQPAPGYARKR